LQVDRIGHAASPGIAVMESLRRSQPADTSRGLVADVAEAGDPRRGHRIECGRRTVRLASDPAKGARRLPLSRGEASPRAWERRRSSAVGTAEHPVPRARLLPRTAASTRAAALRCPAMKHPAVLLALLAAGLGPF